MANRDIITRSDKGSTLTHAEMDQNWYSLTGDVDEKTDDYTVLFTDQNKTIQVNKATTVTMTLSAIATIRTATDVDDFKVTIKNIGAGLCTITSNAADDIDETSGAASITLKQWACVTLQTTAGADWVVVSRDSRTNNLTYTGDNTHTGKIIVDESTDSTSLTTGSIQTDGGLGVVKTIIAGTGIKLGGVAAANLLDDSVKGTWTINLGGNESLSNADGLYVKVGDLVHISGRLAITTIGSGSQSVISGLPFTSHAGTGGSTAHISIYSGVVSSYVHLSLLINPSAATLTIEGNTAASTTQSAVSALQNGASIQFSGTYRTT